MGFPEILWLFYCSVTPKMTSKQNSVAHSMNHLLQVQEMRTFSSLFKDVDWKGLLDVENRTVTEYLISIHICYYISLLLFWFDLYYWYDLYPFCSSSCYINIRTRLHFVIGYFVFKNGDRLNVRIRIGYVFFAFSIRIW